MVQPLKKVKSTSSKSKKSSKATQKGQSMSYMCIFVNYFNCTLLAARRKPVPINLDDDDNDDDDEDNMYADVDVSSLNNQQCHPLNNKSTTMTQQGQSIAIV